MNPIDNLSKEDHGKVSSSEPQLLLDESWFFRNLLHSNSKPRISRCYSDPYPSSTSFNKEEEEEEEILAVGKSLEETFSSLQKLPVNGEKNLLARRSSAGGLVRTPSLPEESSSQAKPRTHHRIQRGNNLTSQTASFNSLSRAPSLPSSIGRKEIDQDEEESDFSMSRLIRQASLKNPDNLPPRYLPKCSSSTPRQRPRRKPDLECVIPGSPEGMVVRKQNPISRSKLTKSSSDLVSQEVESLSIKFDKTELETNEGNKIGGLKEKKLISSKTWEEHNQRLDNSNKSVEDMKAQIRFWARAVASNVRQEC